MSNPQFRAQQVFTKKDGQTLTRSMFLQTPVGEPSERVVLVTISYGGWLETDDVPLYFESSVYSTDHSQTPRSFIRVLERYKTHAEAQDGHIRWCQTIDQPRLSFYEDEP
jgi:hypothetical protein